MAGVARTLRPGGRLLTITYPVPTPEMVGRDDVELHFVMDMDAVHGGSHVAEAATHGELRATIGRRYRLGEGPQACIDFIREHTTGKLVVTR